MHPDELLIKRAAQGDQPAFAELVDRYKAYVLAIILKFVQDKTQAENIAQETFIQVYISLPRYNYRGFKGWIGRIAVNKAIDWQRKNAPLARREILVDMQRLLPCAEQGGNPEEEMIRQADEEKLRVLYEQLPQRYKAIIKDFYFAGKSYKQIARENGIAERTVESRLYRARKLLRRQWQEGG